MRTEGKWPNKVRDCTMQPSDWFPKLILSEHHCNGLGGGDGLVIHVIANELVDLTPRLRALGDGEAELPDPAKHHGEGSWKPRSRDFH